MNLLLRAVPSRTAATCIVVLLVTTAASCGRSQTTAQQTTVPRLAATGGFGLTVSGNRLLDAGGTPVQLRGVDGLSAASPCVNNYGPIDGPDVLNRVGPAPDPGAAATVTPFKQWSANVIRLQLNEDCWLGINGANPAYSGTNYQQVISNYVNTITSQGIYVIVDLHWTAPGGILSTRQDQFPDADHTPAFWTGVATAFKANPAVIFDLFNEPIPWMSPTSNWQCWRDGCTWRSDYPGNPSYQTAGMQSLVDTVRATGARNVLLIGGLGYSGTFFDDAMPPVSQFEAFLARDPLHQVAASIHVYPYTYCHDPACWTANIGPVAEHYPVITGELGEGDGTPQYPSCDGTFLQSFFAWADPRGISYLGWTWNPWNNCAAMVQDFNTGTPMNHGIVLKEHLNALAASPTPSPSPSASPTPVAQFPGGGYAPVPPQRLLDTRNGIGANGPIAAHGRIDLQVSGRAGVPTTATAAVLNVTATNVPADGFLTVWPSGSAMPLASNLNFVAGDTRHNLVEVALGTGGRVSIYSLSGPLDVIADLAGYTTQAGGQGFNPMPSPVRLLDTRAGSHTLGPGQSLRLQVTGTSGVPAGATAAVLNVAAVAPSGPGYLTLWPGDGNPPTASNLNFQAGQTVANRIAVQLSSSGSLSIFNAFGSVDVVVDLNGYYNASGSTFTGISPLRILDTRNSAQTLGPRGTLAVGVVASVPGMPSGARAVVANVTVVGPSTSGFLTAWPGGQAQPPTSDLNFSAGQTIPNLVVVSLGPNGDLNLYNLSGFSDVLVDVLGWYA